MSRVSGRDCLKEPQPADIIATLESALQRLQSSQELLRNAIQAVQQNGLKGDSVSINYLDNHNFGKNLFAACSQSTTAYKSIFADLLSKRDSNTDLDKTAHDWEQITTLRQSLLRASAIADACSRPLDHGHVHDAAPRRSGVKTQRMARPHEQHTDLPIPKSAKRSRPADHDDDSDDDDTPTPRAAKILRATSENDDHPGLPMDFGDIHATPRSQRKRAAESDEDSELSQRATKIIRITDDTPTRKSFAIEIKKRRATRKIRREEFQDVHRYSDEPTTQSDAEVGTPAPWSSDGNSGLDDDYEDVSAEVEARLKAKEAQRLVKKGDMKRKRSSNTLHGETSDVNVQVLSTPSLKRQRHAVDA